MSDQRTPPSNPLNAVALAAAGPYMIAVFRLIGGEVVLDRYTKEFPNGDLPLAVEMLQKDLAKESPWVFEKA